MNPNQHPDVDIDLADRAEILKHIQHTAARIDREQGYDRHNTGIYLQKIPTNPMDGVATIDHKSAGDLGYFKLDLLNNTVYQNVKDEEHLIRLMNQEPDWSMLLDSDVVRTLYHVHQYVGLLREYKPTSVDQLAMLLALIRPGKNHLRGEPWSKIQESVWTAPVDHQYHFKRAHAIAFATVIVVQLNLIREEQDGSSSD